MAFNKSFGIKYIRKNENRNSKGDKYRKFITKQ